MSGEAFSFCAMLVSTDTLAAHLDDPAWVIFDCRHDLADFSKGERLYRAHCEPSERSGEKKAVYATREVILAGGAFNTPQLLMLSGIGPQDELQKHGIEVRVNLPGVGHNLQDRYEVGIVNRLKSN